MPDGNGAGTSAQLFCYYLDSYLRFIYGG